MTEPRRESASGHDLSRLDDSYDIRSELHRGRTTVTFLATHREHGRDVALTVLDAATPAERNALTHLAADARMLTSLRHPHVVPVVETRWLAANRLAIARARVRGSTLRQTLDAVGPMAEERVVEILTELGDVFDWGARSGIVHRHVDSDGVCFQKGNGKVMVSFGLPATLEGGAATGGDDGAFLFDRCADGTTLARLAYEMLTAHRPGDASVESLRAVRGDLSPRVYDAVETGLRCATGGPSVDSRQFLTILTGSTPAIGAAGIATAASAAVVPRTAAAPVPPPQLPLGGPSVGNPAPAQPAISRRPEPDAPVAHPAHAGPASVHHAPTEPAGPTRRRRKGRGLLIASMFALAVVIAGTFALINRDRAERQATSVASDTRGTDAAGDVAVEEELPPDPGGLTVGGAAPADSAGALTGEPAAVTPASPPPAENPVVPVAPPVAVTPAPQAPPRAPEPAQEAPPRTVGDVCESPAAADQRACLQQRIEANDQELNSVYGALMREVRNRDGDGAAEILRDQQRAWLDQRDRQCRNAGSGDLWARERAACFARVSDARALELARALAAARMARP